MSTVPQDPAPLSFLCIDDDTGVLDTFSAYFNSRPGIAVTTCLSPSAALDWLKSHQADAIFCDYAMPEMDGIEFLKEIRSRGNRAFFIIYTGRHLTRVSIDTLNSGGNYYLQKGFTFSEDMPGVIDLIRQHRNTLAAISLPRSVDDPSQLLIDSQFVPVCGFDKNGRIRYTNRFYTREIGKNTGEGSGFYAAIPEDERPEFTSHLATLSAQTPDAHLMHHIRSHGSLKLVLGNYRAFTDDTGSVTGYNALLTPVSGIISLSSIELFSLEEPKARPEPAVQKVPESAAESPVPAKKKKRLKEQVSELQESVEHVHYPLFAIDSAGRIIAWNRAVADLTGVPASDMIGRDGYAHAAVLTGEKRPMLIDYIVQLPHDENLKKTLGIIEDKDVFTSGPDTVRLQGKTVHLSSKGAPIYDAEGALIAAIQSIIAGTGQPAKKSRDLAGKEIYIGGISSIILKVTDRGVGGAIAGALGSAVGGYGVYVTNQRLFVIHNPSLDARRDDSITFGTFILGELFGTNVDTRPREIDELEQYKVFEVWRKDITGMDLRKPKLLAGFLEITTVAGGKFRVYIDHEKAFSHLEQVLKLSYPDILRVE
jgi:PAS domain S-box-containing protein